MNILLSIDRALSGKGRTQLLYLTAVIIFVFFVLYIVGILLFNFNYVSTEGYGFFKRLILVFIDPGSAWETIHNTQDSEQEPSWLFIITAILGIILFLGILISVISNILERRVERFRDGDICYPLNNHIVIIGFDEMVPLLVRQICRNKKYVNCYILIQSSRPSIEVRSKVYAELNSKEEKRLLYLNARRDSTEELEKLYTFRAKEVFIIGDRTSTNHDSLNVQYLSKIVQIHKMKLVKSTIPFKVIFESQSTFATFQITDLSKEWRQYIDFYPINLYKEWADMLLVRNSIFLNNQKLSYPRFDRETLSAHSNKHIHIVIVGMTKMGIALGEEAAHLLHFPNFIDLDENLHKENQTVITFIDEYADTEMDFFIGRHQGYFDIMSKNYFDLIGADKEPPHHNYTNDNEDINKGFLDIRFEFIKGRIESENIRRKFIEWSENENEILSIAICITSSTKAIAMGLYLPNIVYDKKIPVFILQESSSALLDMLCSDKHKDNKHKYSQVYPFGMLDSIYELDDEKLNEAKLYNYIYNYYYTNKTLPSAIPEMDSLNSIWNNIVISSQWSCLYLANSLQYKLNSIGYTDKKLELTQEDIQLLARLEHNRWILDKLLIGNRMPTEEEMKAIESCDEIKNEFKNIKFVHPDIKRRSEERRVGKECRSRWS